MDFILYCLSCKHTDSEKPIGKEEELNAGKVEYGEGI